MTDPFSVLKSGASSLFAMFFSVACSSVTQTTPDNLPIDIKTLDGATDVPVDSSFIYSFTQGVDQSTATSSSFFIVENSQASASTVDKGNVDSSTCDSSGALEATDTCHFSEYCMLDPASDLAGETQYCACLLSSVEYLNGTSFGGFMACFTTAGDETSDVSISSVVDADDNDLSSVTTGINPTSFDITFAQAMDDSSVTTDGNITYTCELPDGNSLEQPSVSVATSESAENAYTVTVTDADDETPYRYQLLDCTLTVTTNVTDSSGAPLLEVAEYTFTNGCAVSDAFNADSQSCWTVIDTSGGYGMGVEGWSDWAGLLDMTSGVLSFDTTEGQLSWDSSDYSSSITIADIYKEVSVDSAGFTITVHLVNVSGIDNWGIGAAIGLAANADLISRQLGGLSGKFVQFALGYSGQAGDTMCDFVYSSDGSTATGSLYSNDCDDLSEIYLRLTVDNMAVTASYSTDGVTYNPIEDVGAAAMPTDQNFTDTPNLILQFIGNNAASTTSIKSIELTGVTATDQY